MLRITNRGQVIHDAFRYASRTTNHISPSRQHVESVCRLVIILLLHDNYYHIFLPEFNRGIII